MKFVWRRSDYDPKALGLIIQVLRAELFHLEKHCYEEKADPEKIQDYFSRIKIEIELAENFFGAIIQPDERGKE